MTARMLSRRFPPLAAESGLNLLGAKPTFCRHLFHPLLSAPPTRRVRYRRFTHRTSHCETSSALPDEAMRPQQVNHERPAPANARHLVNEDDVGIAHARGKGQRQGRGWVSLCLKPRDDDWQEIRRERRRHPPVVSERRLRIGISPLN